MDRKQNQDRIERGAAMPLINEQIIMELQKEDLGLTLRGIVRQWLINRLRNLHLGCPKVSSCILFS